MKNFGRLIIVGCLVIGCTGLTESAQVRSEQFGFEPVIEALYDVLEEQAQKGSFQDFPALTKAEVTLNCMVVKEGGAKVKFVVAGGGNMENSQSSKITVGLKRPQRNGVGLQGFDPKSMRRELSKIITAAQEAWASARRAKDNRGGKELLTPRHVEIELEFVAKTKGELGVDFELYGVGIEAGGARSNGDGHTLKLIYGDE